MNGDKLWLVGQMMEPRWEFYGVFETEEEATVQCLNEDFFIAPVIVGEEMPNATVSWPGAYYPKAKIE